MSQENVEIVRTALDALEAVELAHRLSLVTWPSPLLTRRDG